VVEGVGRGCRKKKEVANTDGQNFVRVNVGVSETKGDTGCKVVIPIVCISGMD